MLLGSYFEKAEEQIRAYTFDEPILGKMSAIETQESKMLMQSSV